MLNTTNNNVTLPSFPARARAAVIEQFDALDGPDHTPVWAGCLAHVVGWEVCDCADCREDQRVDAEREAWADRYYESARACERADWDMRSLELIDDRLERLGGW